MPDRVKIAVLLLSGRDLGDQAVEIDIELGIGSLTEGVRSPLNNLEHIGVVVVFPLVRARFETAGAREVTNAPGLFCLLKIRWDCDRAIGLNSRLPEGIVHPDGSEKETASSRSGCSSADPSRWGEQERRLSKAPQTTQLYRHFISFTRMPLPDVNTCILPTQYRVAASTRKVFGERE